VSATQVVARHLSVVVSTRNRPEHIVDCVTAILACRGLLDLIVVDQSDDSRTRDLLIPRELDRRLRYVPAETRGVSAGRNLAIALSTAPLVAFTDDDCRVSVDWIDRIEDVFAAEPDAAIVCGSVTVPPELAKIGYAAEFRPSRRTYRRFPPPGEWGISANMTIRRDVFDAVGAFDPVLGAGAPLRSGAELDLTVRAIRAGFAVVNAPEVEVTHLGVRAHGDEASGLFRGYGIGIGATFSKHARLGDRGGALLYLRWLGHLAMSSVVKVLTLRRPTGVAFLASYIYGSILSLRYGIDSETAMYQPRPSKKNMASSRGRQ
jgi:GT2 family glycosyltransferase